MVWQGQRTERENSDSRLTTGLGADDSDDTALYRARESEVQGTLSLIAYSSVRTAGLRMQGSDLEAAT